MEHLIDKVKEVALADDASRIAFILEERFIFYGRIKRLLAEMDDLLSCPVTNRMRCMIVYGEGGNGKTALLQQFFKRHEPEVLPGRDHVYAPVVGIQSPYKANENFFFGTILNQCFVQYRVNDRLEKKQDLVYNLLRKMETRVLIIDEMDQMLKGSPAKQRDMLNLLKHMNNELKISIIGAGTQDSFYALESNQQLARRFLPKPLVEWQYHDRDYHQILKTYEGMLPLRKPSDLRKESVAQKIINLSSGTIAEIVTVLQEAAKLAIVTGKEHIDEQLLKKITHLSITERRNINTVRHATQKGHY